MTDEDHKQALPPEFRLGSYRVARSAWAASASPAEQGNDVISFKPAINQRPAAIVRCAYYAAGMSDQDHRQALSLGSAWAATGR